MAGAGVFTFLFMSFFHLCFVFMVRSTILFVQELAAESSFLKSLTASIQNIARNLFSNGRVFNCSVSSLKSSVSIICSLLFLLLSVVLFEGLYTPGRVAGKRTG